MGSRPSGGHDRRYWPAAMASIVTRRSGYCRCTRGRGGGTELLTPAVAYRNEDGRILKTPVSEIRICWAARTVFRSSGNLHQPTVHTPHRIAQLVHGVAMQSSTTETMTHGRATRSCPGACGALDGPAAASVGWCRKS